MEMFRVKKSEEKAQFIWWAVVGSNLDVRNIMEKCPKVWSPYYLKKQLAHSAREWET